jgi:hypothetical protein
MRKTIEVFLSSVILVLIFDFSADSSALGFWGQAGSTTASITGTVTDEQGAIVAGAAIMARNLNTNLTRETYSGENGSFLISQLPPGAYELTSTAEGFTSRVLRIDLILGTTTLLNLVMKLGATSEIIEVTAMNAISEEKTESSSNNGRDRIDNLPINMRNFLDFSLTSPRVTKDRFPGQGVAATSGLSFNGQPARFNNITIDGVDNNEPFSGAVLSTLSQDAVQEFQVVSDGYSAEFGRAFGGVVNIVTRGGTNDFHGNIFGFLRNDRISARDVFSPFEPPYRQYQFGTTFGGPIRRDKAFFFTSFERLSVKQSRFVTISNDSVSAAQRLGFPLRNGPVPFSLGVTSVLGRADLRLTPNNTLYLRYNGGFNYNGALEPFGGQIGETNGGTQNLRDNSIAASNTYVNAQLKLVNETRFVYVRREQIVLPIDSAGPQVQIFAPEGLIVFGRRTLLPQPRKQRSNQIIDNVSLMRGRHQIKFGVDFSYTDAPVVTIPIVEGGVSIFTPLNFASAFGIPGAPVLTGLQTFDPTLRTSEQRFFLTMLSGILPNIIPGFPKGLQLADLSLPFAYIQGFGNAKTPITAKRFASFIQDDLKLKPNLLLKFGLRYDINRVTGVPENGGNISPRIAVSYRPKENINLHAAYGVFFTYPLLGASTVVLSTDSGNFKIPVVPFPFSTIPFALPAHRLPNSDQVPPDIPFIPQLSLIFRYQPDLRESYAQQATAGIDYFVTNNTAISLSYAFIRGIKLISVNNFNPIVHPIPGDPLTSAIVGRVDPTQGDVFIYTSSFDSYYNAATISLVRRFANRFGLTASYTFSKAIDNFQDFLRNELEVNDSLNIRNERGLSLQDVRSRFLLSGTWELSYTKRLLLRDFQLSGILALESGRAFNLLAGADLNLDGDNPPGDRPLGIARNAGITPGFASLDLRLTRSIGINENLKFQGFIEVFNAFNRVNISELNRLYPPDDKGNFNLPSQKNGRFIATRDRYRNAFSPRQFQVGFRFTF